MKRAAGGYGSAGEGSKVRQHVARGKGRVSVARDRDCKIERKHVADGRLDMPTKDELAESLRDGFCWWCGRTHTDEGKEISHWSLHFVKAHCLDLQKLRDILGVPKTYGFVTANLSERLSERSRRQLAEHPDHAKALRRGAKRKTGKRSFSKHGCRVQREKAARYRRRHPNHLKRAARKGAQMRLAKRQPIRCAACDVLFSPLRLKGQVTRTTCSDECANEMKRRSTAALMRAKRKPIVCRGCGKEFWRRGQPATCSIECARAVQSRTASDPEPKARGERNAKARLTERIVVEIREQYARGDVSQAQLAERHNVLQSSISSVVLGKSWRHVGGPIAKPKSLSECGQRSRVSR